jgi:trigger factor
LKDQDMQATVETVSTLERRMTVAMPMQPIEEEIGKRLQNIARTARMPGFRPGKVPFKVVVQQYGNQVRQEVVSGKVEESFGEAVNQHQLRVAGYPNIEPKPLAENSDSYEYVATFEVFPEVRIDDLSKLKIERPKVTLSDKDVDSTLEVLRKQRTVYEPVTRAAKKGDRLSIQVASTIDGKKVEDTSGQSIDIVLGEAGRIADFDKNLTGAKVGQNKKFDVVFPEDYQNKDVAGKTASYDVTVTAVAAATVPEADADFAMELGVEDGNVDKMLADIRESLGQEVEKRIQAVISKQVMDGLAEQVALDIPRSLVAIEINNQMQAAAQNLQQRGMNPADINMNPEMFDEQAKRSVKLRMIVSELVRANELQPKPEQIRAVVEEFAKSFEQPDEVVSWYFADPQRLDEPAAVAVEQNVVAWVLERAKVADKKTSFDDLMGKGQA